MKIWKYENMEIWVIVIMMLICDASVVVSYDRRRSRLCNAAITITRKYMTTIVNSCHRDMP
mgnify:CR=1 FL=1